MEKQAIHKLVNARPNDRALAAIELGYELKAPARKVLAAGTMPPPVDFADFPVNVKRILNRLHGVNDAEPERAVGMRETGRSLDTSLGAVRDLVLTAQNRKRVAKSARVKKSGEDDEDVALRQLALGMLDPSIAPRVCAAHAYWQATGAADVATPVLAAALEGAQDEEDHLLAAHALALVDATKVSHLVGDDVTSRATPAAKKTSITVIIHGTFARNNEWHQPGGSFHTYIKDQVYPDVYSGSDFYRWSGAYGTERMLRRIWKTAAESLVAWVKAHPADIIRLMAHSHGNNVVNWATRIGLPTSCTLIQMSPPVRDWNLPDMNTVSSKTLYSIYASRDLVIALDRGAVTYAGTGTAAFEKKKRVARFSHSASREGRVWDRQKVDRLVTRVCPP